MSHAVAVALKWGCVFALWDVEGILRSCYSNILLTFDPSQDTHGGSMPAYFRFLTILAFHIFLQEKVGRYNQCTTSLISGPVFPSYLWCPCAALLGCLGLVGAPFPFCPCSFLHTPDRIGMKKETRGPSCFADTIMHSGDLFLIFYIGGFILVSSWLLMSHNLYW